MLTGSLTHAVENPAPQARQHYSRNYEFTEDWFTHHIPVWEQIMQPLKGKPLHYLEIGVFEGRSAFWILENVLTNPGSKMTVIDIFPGDLLQRFQANVKLSGSPEKVTILEGFSQDKLRELPFDSCDIIYIDASHSAADVLSDATLSWKLLKEGGLLIFDDYLWSPQYPSELTPKIAIDAFLAAFRNEIKILRQDYQVVVQKVSNPCRVARTGSCSPVGLCAYHWAGKRLYSIAADRSKSPVPLSERQTMRLERQILRRSSLKEGGLPGDVEGNERVIRRCGFIIQ